MGIGRGRSKRERERGVAALSLMDRLKEEEENYRFIYSFL